MRAPATGIRIIPPVLFLAAFLIGWFLHWLWPFSLGLPLSPRVVVGLIITLATLALLEAAFGEEYRQYKARVRRWL